jgi:hypothetical protein
MREIRHLADENGVIGGDKDSINKYLATRKKGLKKTGILYWAAQRIGMAHVKILNSDGPLPEVDESDPEIGLPDTLR